MFGLVDWAARKGLSESAAPPSRETAKQRALRTGVRGETYAYWYLRRHGYVMIARNFTFRGMKGEEVAQLVSFLTGSLGDFWIAITNPKK